MRTAAKAVVVSCLLVLATAQPHDAFPDPIITYTPGTGLEFRLRDDGYHLASFHYNINRPLNGVAHGDHAQDVNVKTGNEWVHTDNTVQLQPGDTVGYWVLVINSLGQGLQITERTWTYVQTVATTTTTPRPTTTRRPTTAAPPNSNTVTAGVHVQSTAAPGDTGSVGGGSSGGGSFVTGSGSNAGIPLSSGTGSNPDHGSGSGSSTLGSGSGSCNCDYGPGIRDGFVDDRTCRSFPCLIFEDNFDFINHRVWEHELTASGGGNWEFQYYTNNRSNSYTRDGVLYIKPTLTSDHFGTEFLEHGKLDLWGGSPADVCTSNMDWGCKREGQPGQVVNPIQSARLRSSRGFNFRYGKVEVEAKLPSGDWLWPAIWMVPRLNVYGNWPASGEIDIMESRGNLNYHDPQGKSLGPDTVGSTLHFGADFWTNRWPTAHKEVSLSTGGTYADDFHKYGVEWTNTSITFTVDGQEILRVAPGAGGFWEYGGLDQVQGHENPWRGASRMAPFDQEFYLILNVAVGGVGFFNDQNRNSPYGKPWQDGAGHEADRFWAARNQWYPTWHPDQNNGEDAAMKVNYVKVWKTKPDPRP